MLYGNRKFFFPTTIVSHWFWILWIVGKFQSAQIQNEFSIKPHTGFDIIFLVNEYKLVKDKSRLKKWQSQSKKKKNYTKTNHRHNVAEKSSQWEIMKYEWKLFLLLSAFKIWRKRACNAISVDESYTEWLRIKAAIQNCVLYWGGLHKKWFSKKKAQHHFQIAL